jgi:hypothetical protein
VQVALPDAKRKPPVNVNMLLQWLEIPEQPQDAVHTMMRVKTALPIVMPVAVREHINDLAAVPYRGQSLNQGVAVVFRQKLLFGVYRLPFSHF